MAKPRYSNIDNYHYWQMNQLNTALTMDALLQETLNEVGETDDYWGGLNVEGFRNLLDTDWRTAGEWSLSVSHPDRMRALQALEVWSNVATEKVQGAVGSARSVIMIDQELEQVAVDLFAAQRRTQSLAAGRASLQEWVEQSAGLAPDQPLAPVERWRIFSAAASLALDDPAVRFISQWRNDARKSRITLRQLGSHTSGIEYAAADVKQKADPIMTGLPMDPPLIISLILMVRG